MVRDDGACTQGSSRDQAETAEIEGAPNFTAYCHHVLPFRSLLASPYRERWPLQQNGRSKLLQTRPAAARAAIAYTEMLAARKQVHYVEDSMRVRAHFVASARRHLPCLAFACTRMRGDTIVAPELNQIGVKKRAQNQLRFAMKLYS